MITAGDIIRILNLQKLPTEGGYFSETYRSKNSTAIYYLLTDEIDCFSEMHRLAGDEIYHFYLGEPVEMLHLYPDGAGKRVFLGADLETGLLPQVLVPAGVWQGSRLARGGKFALMGTTMAPGFEYWDYKSGSRKELINLYPGFEELITTLTRKP
jgi:predicted cupin superfamily sugar epimerase